MSNYEDAVSFFHEQAGFSYDPVTETLDEGKRRTAQALAHAEQWAAERFVYYEWSDDWGIDHGTEFECYEDGGPDTCEQVVMHDGAEEVGSLCCVDDADADYRRVVEAELALEYMRGFTVWVA